MNSIALTPQQKLSFLAESCKSGGLLTPQDLESLSDQVARRTLSSDIGEMTQAFRSLIGSVEVIEPKIALDILIIGEQLLKQAPEEDQDTRKKLILICTACDISLLQKQKIGPEIVLSEDVNPILSLSRSAQNELFLIEKYCQHEEVNLIEKEGRLTCLFTKTIRPINRETVEAFQQLIDRVKEIDDSVASRIYRITERLLSQKFDEDPWIAERLNNIVFACNITIKSQDAAHSTRIHPRLFEVSTTLQLLANTTGNSVAVILETLRTQNSTALQSLQSSQTTIDAQNFVAIGNRFLTDPVEVKNGMSMQNIGNMIDAATWLHLDTLRHQCEAFLIVRLSKMTFFSDRSLKKLFPFWHIAHRYDLVELKSKCDQILMEALGNQFFDFSFTSLLKLYKANNIMLSHLDESFNNTRFYELLNSQSQIESLSLSTSTFKRYQGKLVQLTRLNSIHLNGEIDESIISLFRENQNLQNIQKLSTNCSNTNLINLLALLQNLQSLILISFNHANEEHLQMALAQVPHLQNLELVNYENHTNRGLKEALTQTLFLKTLAIKGVFRFDDRLTVEGLGIALRQLNELLNLTIDMPSTEDELRLLLSAIPKIRYLNGNFFQFTDLSNTEYLMGLSNIQNLNLINCKQVDNAFVESLSALKFLNTLNLSYCPKITDAGFVHFPKIRELRDLNLAYCTQPSETVCNITGIGLAHLINCIKLTYLNISRITSFTYEAAREFASVTVQFKILKKGELAQLSGCASLQRVYINEHELLTKDDLLNLETPLECNIS